METPELHRRLDNLIRLGTVAEVIGDRARVQTGDNLTGLRPWLTHRAGADASWWAPSVGEQVVLLSPGGDLAQALILPALYQSAHAAPSTNPAVHQVTYRDGTQLTVDTNAKTLSIKPAGGLTIQVQGDVTLTAQGQCTVTAGGVLKLTGQLVQLN